MGHEALTKHFYKKDGSINESPSEDFDVYQTGLLATGNWLENQQIYDEFNHYQESGTILGNHPVFRVFLLRKSIKRLSDLKADKRIRNLEHYLRRDHRNFEKIKDPTKIAQAKNKIALRTEELSLIKEIHNFE